MDNKEAVIAYGGKYLTKEEKKYSTSEKELLAVVRGVQAYRPYLAGNNLPSTRTTKLLSGYRQQNILVDLNVGLLNCKSPTLT